MALNATAWAWRQQALKPSCKFVLLALAAFHVAYNGRCNPSLKQLVTMTLLDRTTIIRCIKDLCEKCLVTKTINLAKGSQRKNSYQLNVNDQNYDNGSMSPPGGSLDSSNPQQISGATQPTMQHNATKKEAPRYPIYNINNKYKASSNTEVPYIPGVE